MSRNELENKTVKELRDIAKGLNIVGRWDMTKKELVDKILEVNGEEPKKNREKKLASEDANKMEYVKNAPVGKLVAFEDERGKIRTAKIDKKSSSGEKLKLVTEYGAEFIVPYDKVLWVRTGKRWPRGIYNMLKGIEE